MLHHWQAKEETNDDIIFLTSYWHFPQGWKLYDSSTGKGVFIQNPTKMRLGLASLCHTGKSHGNLDRENTVLSLIPWKIRIAMRLQNSRCTSCNDLTNPNGRGLYSVYSIVQIPARGQKQQVARWGLTYFLEQSWSKTPFCFFPSPVKIVSRLSWIN